MQDWIKRRIEGLLDNIIFASLCTVGVVIWSAVIKLPGPIIFIIGLAAFALILWIFAIIKGKLLEKGKDENLRSIPRIIFKMHERLASLIEHSPPLAETELEAFLEQYFDLLGLTESRYPELKQARATSDIKAKREIMGAVLEKFVSEWNEMNTDGIKLLIVRLGGVMDIEGAGINQVRDGDKRYAKLKRRLDELRPEIPTELNTAIANYLQFSFGLLSMYQVNRATSDKESIDALPPKWGAEVRIWKEQRMDIAMNELLAEVVSIVRKLICEATNSPLTSPREGPQK